jgi:hypothetical protein
MQHSFLIISGLIVGAVILVCVILWTHRSSLPNEGANNPLNPIQPFVEKSVCFKFSPGPGMADVIETAPVKLYTCPSDPYWSGVKVAVTKNSFQGCSPSGMILNLWNGYWNPVQCGGGDPMDLGSLRQFCGFVPNDQRYTFTEDSCPK